MAGVHVQMAGVFWALSQDKFVNLNFEVGTGRRVASLFHRGRFSGWCGEWHVANDNVLILIEATRYGWNFSFDGRLQLRTAGVHTFYPMRPALQMFRTTYHLEEIQILDDATPAINIVMVEQPVVDAPSPTDVVMSSTVSSTDGAN